MSAHRGRSQVLAAAGAGAWAAVRSGVLGTLLGWLLIVLASILATTAARVAGGVLGLQMSIRWTPGWNTVLTAAGLNVGALLAGAAAVRVVAQRGWRKPADVRLAVTAAGGLVLGCFALVILEQALNWASVIALLLVPVSFGVGARFERFRLPGSRPPVLMLLVGLLLLMAASLTALAASGGGAATSYQWSETTHGYEMIAPWWQDPASGRATDFPSADSGSSAPGLATVSVQAASPAVIARFRDFRLEAWRAQAPQDGWRLLPDEAAPFATAAASVEGTTVSGALRFNQAPGVDWAEVVLTAIGPDGRRYLLTASGPEQTDFYGSVWSWFDALTR